MLLNPLLAIVGRLLYVVVQHLIFIPCFPERGAFVSQLFCPITDALIPVCRIFFEPSCFYLVAVKSLESTAHRSGSRLEKSASASASSPHRRASPPSDPPLCPGGSAPQHGGRVAAPGEGLCVRLSTVRRVAQHPPGGPSQAPFREVFLLGSFSIIF